MSKKRKQYRLDLSFYFGESLFEGRHVNGIERVLLEEAREWSSGLFIWRKGAEEERQIVRNFERDVRAFAAERGPYYDQLVKKHGRGPYERRTGSVELRGADDSLIVVVHLDDYRFAPSAGRWLWGNTFSVQVCAPRIEGEVAALWSRRLAARACGELSPLYAHGHIIEEFDHKNISHEGGGVMRVGADVSRYLPGLYWLNFFGSPYCTLIGKDRLLEAPAHETEELDAGVLVVLASDPGTWNTADYRATERRVLKHLGNKHFFDRRKPRRKTLAPDFGLKPLPRHPRFS